MSELAERETVTNLAAGPPEPPAPRPRVGRWLAGVAVLAIVATAAYLIVARLQKGYQYRKEVKAVLVPLTSGDPARAEEVYEAASPRFKQTLILDAFLDLAHRMHETLGRFERIIDVLEVERTSTVAGLATRVEVELEFEHGRTIGELSFLHSEGRDPPEILLGLDLEIPRTRLDDAAALEGDGSRLRAPEVVLEAVERIARLLQDGKVAEIHAAAAPAFKATVTPQALLELTRGHAEDLGPFVGLVKVLTSAQNERRDLARVQALLQYQKRRTTATLEFIQLEDGWKLVAFRVEVPGPISPVSGPPPEDDDRPDDDPAAPP